MLHLDRVELWLEALFLMLTRQKLTILPFKVLLRVVQEGNWGSIHNTATIRNQDKITNGIINNGGTLTVFNDFRKDESATNGYYTIREIGKTAKGVL